MVIAREDSDSDQSDLPDKPKSNKPKPKERVKLDSEDNSDIQDKPQKTSKGFQPNEQDNSICSEGDSDSDQSDLPVHTKRNKAKPKQMEELDSESGSDIPDKPKRKELKPEKPTRKGLKPDKPVKPVQEELDSNDEDDYGIKQRLPKKEFKSIPKEEKKKYTPKTFLQSLSSDIACPT